MKKNLLLTFLFLFYFISFGFTQNKDIYFMSSPTLSPDAQVAIFNYESDLWKVNAQGGLATRLTAMQGEETYPRISPDGKWLAFTGSQFGSQDIFLMPMAGGEIKRLTFHQAYDQVDSWSWDSKFIYFTSNRFNRSSGYKVSIEEGTPVRLFDNYFNTVHSVIEHPSSGEIFFNETWESRSATNRKRYKGAYNPDIQSYNPKTKEFKEYTDYNGKDFWVSLDKNGKMYFVSDELNGEYNLHTFEGSTKTALTRFDTSIKNPFVSANGEKVVFEKDYQLYLYDVASKKSQKIAIQLFQNPVLEKSQKFEVKNNIENVDISPDAKKMAFVSRGELFVSDIKGKFMKQLSTNPLGRITEVKWLKDNKTLVFNQTTEDGYLNWFRISADGNSSEKQLTSDTQNNRLLELNKDKTQGVYLSGRNEVRLLDLKTYESKTLVKEELWAFQNAQPRFSPNGEYVLFTSHRNFEQDIFIHHLKNNKTINLTQTGITETNPFWSPDGKHIYFIADRLNPSYPFGTEDARVYRVPLQKLEDAFASDKFDEMFEEKAEAKKEDKDDKKKEETKPEKPTEPIQMDLEDLMLRLERISPDFGSQSDVFVTQKDDKTYVIFGSNHDEGKYNLWKTTIEPFERNKTEKIEGATTGSASLVEVDGKFYTLIDGSIHSVNLDAKKVEKIDVSFSFERNLADEFEQMFYETWANLEENFYNETFHGLDWKATKTQYATFLPYLNSRQNLRTLLSDMLGELNSSHLGFNSGGKEEDIFYNTATMTSGIIFEEDKPYQVKYIVKNSATDKVGKDIKAGDILLKVNGETVDTKKNREMYFSKSSLEDELEMTFSRAGKEITTKIHPQSYGELQSELYDEWIANNQKIVDDKGKKRIAYAYMKNMGGGELEKFLIDMNSEAYQRDALIFDLRYNTGGNVHDKVLQFLSQKPYLKWKYREGALTIQSNFAPAAKPIVLLINEQSLSDAEMTAAGFKALGLGKIIGTETYRWIIFTSGKGLVDGSFYRLPSWGCYTLDGKNLEKEGVQPDISIKTTFKDRIEGRDPQLDRAIEEIMKDLK
jgi:tricorn protease